MTLLHEPAGRRAVAASDMGTPAVAGDPTVEAMIEPGDSGGEVDFDVGDSYADSDQTTSVVPRIST